MSQLTVLDSAGATKTIGALPNTGPQTAAQSLSVTPTSEGFSVSPDNFTKKFREAFEDFSTTADPDWDTAIGAGGDLVFLDGNAAGASYLVISKSPLAAGNETSVGLKSQWAMSLPLELSVGMHMSQRTLGQEASIEVVDTSTPLPDVAELAISAISQTTTVLTIDFATPHGLAVGKSVGIYGCSNTLLNYPALVVASVPSPTQLTCTAGPNGTIVSQTVANPSGAKGSVYYRDRMGRANDGVAQIFESTSATQSAVYVRSGSGDAIPSGTVAGQHTITVGTTASTALVNSPYTYAFSAATEYRLIAQADRVQVWDSAVDSIAQGTSRQLRTQVCPDPSSAYFFRTRVTNTKGLTVPSAQIVSATKTGTTTATIVTATAHGLAVNDPVVVYGIRDQAAASFPNLATATAVASIVDATTFTIVIGTASTVTSYGGYVARINGGNLMSALGATATAVQTATLSTLADGTRQLVVTLSAATAVPLIGDLVELVGARDAVSGATLAIDGPWKVANNVTTTLTLVLPYAGQRTIPDDFVSTNCGGGIIKRTDVRLSFVRAFEFERLRVENTPRPTGDIALAAPVSVQNVPAVTVSSGTITTVSTVSAATLAASTALSNDVGVQMVGARGTLLAITRLVSAAATTNATLVKASAGKVGFIEGFNASATTKFIKLYNKATAPVPGTDVPVVTLALPVGRFSFNCADIGLNFATGIGFALTGGVADADTTAVAAGDIVALNVLYS